MKKAISNAVKNGVKSVKAKIQKAVKMFQFRIEFCPNRNIVIIHTRKMFPKAQTDPMMRAHFDKAQEKKEVDGNKHPLIASIKRLKGVLKVSSEQYELRIEKAEMFTWDEILPKVRIALKKHFADGKELDELPAQVPSKEYLAGLRSHGCDV